MGESFKGVFRGGTWIEAQDGENWYDLRGSRGIGIREFFDDDAPEESNRKFDVVVVWTVGKGGSWTSFSDLARYSDKSVAQMICRSIMTALRRGEIADVTLPQDDERSIGLWEAVAKTRGGEW